MSALRTYALTDVEILACVVAGEARGEGEWGMRAVAEVIRNRGGSSFVRTVQKPYQFSCLNGTTPEKLAARVKSDRNWPLALKIAGILLHRPQDLGDTTGGANHYHEISIKRPKWADPKKQTVKIGNHIFYRL